MSELLFQSVRDQKFKAIALKAISGERLSPDEGLHLYESDEIAALSVLASEIRKRKNGNKVYFVRNFHIEPTNKCVYHCKFCSYSEHMAGHAWEHSIEEMLDMVRGLKKDITELHITGGVHPKHGLEYYAGLLEEIRKIRPDLHLKAYSAIEIHQMASKARLNYKETIEVLKKAGLASIPGGGAEIFDPEIRKKICPDKGDTEAYLEIHKTAHEAGLPTNATMLYGHIEEFKHRIDHLERLRQLQDETRGFNAFIPLKYKAAHNAMGDIGEVPLLEDLRNYAVSRIYLDNFPHIKAYWPMIGKEAAALSLAFGVDDLDGTIEDSTKIYTMAGMKEDASMTTDELIAMAAKQGYTAVERDAVYRVLSIEQQY